MAKEFPLGLPSVERLRENPGRKASIQGALSEAGPSEESLEKAFPLKAPSAEGPWETSYGMGVHEGPLENPWRKNLHRGCPQWRASGRILGEWVSIEGTLNRGS